MPLNTLRQKLHPYWWVGIVASFGCLLLLDMIIRLTTPRIDVDGGYLIIPLALFSGGVYLAYVRGMGLTIFMCIFGPSIVVLIYGTIMAIYRVLTEEGEHTLDLETIIGAIGALGGIAVWAFILTAMARYNFFILFLIFLIPTRRIRLWCYAASAVFLPFLVRWLLSGDWFNLNKPDKLLIPVTVSSIILFFFFICVERRNKTRPSLPFLRQNNRD